jgi:hypothetical protein
MGYTTYYSGGFDISPPLSGPLSEEMYAFSGERHEGGGFPSIWCDWIPNASGNILMHNDSEKSYEAEGWIRFLIEKFLKPNGHVLNGHVSWSGEENGDTGIIYAKNNVVEAVPDETSNPGPSWEKENEEESC